MEDKEKFRRNTRVFQGILTQSSAKFAEKMRANFYENKFLKAAAFRTLKKSRANFSSKPLEIIIRIVYNNIIYLLKKEF